MSEPWCDPSEWMTDGSSSKPVAPPTPEEYAAAMAECDRMAAESAARFADDVMRRATHRCTVRKKLGKHAMLTGVSLSTGRSETLAHGEPFEGVYPGKYLLKACGPNPRSQVFKILAAIEDGRIVRPPVWLGDWPA